MFNIDWSRLVAMLTPPFWRQPNRAAWLLYLAYPVRLAHARFMAFKSEVDLLNYYNSQIIYLEKRLNDKWDPVGRGIYIDNLADLDRMYIFNKIEGKLTTRVFNKWDPTILYGNNNMVTRNRKIYVSQAPTINQDPAVNPVWRFVRDQVVARNKAEFDLQNDFIVYVPSGVTFNQSEMKAVVNLYKFASLRYTIIIY